MTELELQKYLRGPRVGTMVKYKKNIHTLEEEYGIVARQSEVNPELYLFKYSQIDSPMKERIVQESRGIILNRDNNWSIVARPYDKFFNYGEGHAAEIDWDTATCYDKLDGSLVTLYYYKGKWRVATSGNPDAAGEVWNGFGKKISFADLFWQTWNKQGYKVPTADGGESRFAFSHGEIQYKHWESISFMFELMTPYNKVVVQHFESKLVLHGARSIKSGNELYINPIATQFGWEACPTFPINTIEDIVASAEYINPINNEGYVVTDLNFNRIKVKSPQYVALHHMRDSLSPRRMLEIVATNEGSEFLTYFPELEEMYNETKLQYNKLIVLLSNEIGTLLHTYPNPSRKDIGLATRGQFWQGIVFPIIFDGKSIPEMLAQMPIKKLEDWINKI